jgi:hypothetical protein
MRVLRWVVHGVVVFSCVVVGPGASGQESQLALKGA